MRVRPVSHDIISATARLLRRDPRLCLRSSLDESEREARIAIASSPAPIGRRVTRDANAALVIQA
jgi:hypothetical protein